MDLKYNNKQMHITLELPYLKYIDEFLHLKCRDDLLKTGWFNNAKEITESMAVFKAYFKYFYEKVNNPIIIVIGDGVFPRTASLFAFRTPYWIVSIDPLLKIDNEIKYFDFPYRLWGIKSKIENININYSQIFTLPSYFENCILIFCHSHASIKQSILTLKSLYKHFYIISMPCCVPDDLPILPFKNYEDYGVFSPKRRINLYKI